jgi:pyruvate/2-oxoglutarate/acetoin dehydrogenase E1 component
MDLTYSQALRDSMTMLGRDPLTRVCGYGLTVGHEKASFQGVPIAQICEFTVAEGLMTSAAIGMALTGLRPVVFIERADFLYNAMDAICNHLDKCREISKGEFNPCVIFRVVIGNRVNGLKTGPTHTYDPSDAMKHLVRFPIYGPLRSPDEVLAAYERAKKDQDDGRCSSMIFEQKDLY